jgi:hypothetical protein
MTCLRTRWGEIWAQIEEEQRRKNQARWKRQGQHHLPAAQPAEADSVKKITS